MFDCDCKVLDKDMQIRFAYVRQGIDGYICDMDAFHPWSYYEKEG